MEESRSFWNTEGKTTTSVTMEMLNYMVYIGIRNKGLCD